MTTLPLSAPNECALKTVISFTTARNGRGSQAQSTIEAANGMSLSRCRDRRVGERSRASCTYCVVMPVMDTSQSTAATENKLHLSLPSGLLNVSWKGNGILAVHLTACIGRCLLIEVN